MSRHSIIDEISENPAAALSPATSGNVSKISKIDLLIHARYTSSSVQVDRPESFYAHQDWLIAYLRELESRSPGIIKRIFNQRVSYPVEPKNQVLSGKTGRMTSLLVNYFFHVYDFVLHTVPDINVGKHDLSGVFMMLLYCDIGTIPPGDVVSIRRIVQTLRERTGDAEAYGDGQLRDMRQSLLASYSTEKGKTYALSGGIISFANYASGVYDPVSGKSLRELEDIFNPWEYRPWYVNEHMEFEQLLYRLDQVNGIFNRALQNGGGAPLSSIARKIKDSLRRSGKNTVTIDMVARCIYDNTAEAAIMAGRAKTMHVRRAHRAMKHHLKSLLPDGVRVRLQAMTLLA